MSKLSFKTRETSDSLNSGHPDRSLIQKLLWNVSHDLGNGLIKSELICIGSSYDTISFQVLRCVQP